MKTNIVRFNLVSNIDCFLPLSAYKFCCDNIFAKAIIISPSSDRLFAIFKQILLYKSLLVKSYSSVPWRSVKYMNGSEIRGFAEEKDIWSLCGQSCQQVYVDSAEQIDTKVILDIPNMLRGDNGTAKYYTTERGFKLPSCSADTPKEDHKGQTYNEYTNTWSWL